MMVLIVAYFLGHPAVSFIDRITFFILGLLYRSMGFNVVILAVFVISTPNPIALPRHTVGLYLAWYIFRNDVIMKTN